MDITLRDRLPARFVATLGLVLMLSAFGTGHAHANGPVAAQSAGNTVSASATLNFRIVVAETLRLGGQQQRQSATAPTTTRTVTNQGDHQLVTLARP